MSVAPAPGVEAGSLRARWQAYRRDSLGDDLVAAAIVTLLLVPQSLAYALLAGLPPVVGVMASLLPLLAYAALGSSSTLAVGPVAVLAMMTAQAIGPAAAAHGVAPHAAALVLALEMALVFALAWLLRLEVFAALLSAPVLHGFVTGAALAIAAGQLPALLGVRAQGQTLPELIASFVAQPALPHAATAALGLAALAGLVLVRRHGAALLQRAGLPGGAARTLARTGPIAVVAGAVAAVALAPGLFSGVSLAGGVDLAQGLHFPLPWQQPVGLWADLAAPAALLALVAYVESLAVAEALGARRGQTVRPRRELLGLAAANAVAGVSGGMPVTGGFARSIVNVDAGARTRLTGVWTALMLAGVVALGGDLLASLPKAVLAATIVVAVLSLVDLGPFRRAWAYNRREFALMGAVAGLTLGAGVEPALGLGVLASIALLLQRTARPHWAEVGRLPGTDVFRNVRRFAVETLPQVLSVRVDESLVFTNSRWLSETLQSELAARPRVTDVVLMMPGVNEIDLSGLEALEQLDARLRAQGRRLHLSELKGPLRDRLARVGWTRGLSGRVFDTQAQAHEALAANSGAPGDARAAASTA